MFPFWEMVVAPIVKAAEAQRVLEIGALRGETTAKMFDQLSPTSELYVIDPLPQFDPADHEQEFPGRYIFHRDLSLNVLPHLPPMDVALIDGDHNWYTVFHELQWLDRTSREAGRPLPVLILHDVHWPYGHRDLYYEPSQIPEEFRQPYRKAGIAPGYYQVLETGGFNYDLHNAVNAGGPRNGVKRALDDFLEAYDRPVREVVLPFYFGLAIVVDQEVLSEHPKIERLLDNLESAAGRERLLKLSERIRIDEQVHVHNWNRVLERRADRHRDRYLELLKGALLDEHYLENEVRLDYLIGLPPDATPDWASLRDPARTMEVRFKRIAQARTAGRSTDEPKGRTPYPYTDMGRAALDHLEETVAGIADQQVPGDLVECGVGRGGGAIFIRACLDSYLAPERTVWLVDPFLASHGPGPVPADTQPQSNTTADLNQVRDGFERFGLADDRTRFVVGPFDQTVNDLAVHEIALLRIGQGTTPGGVTRLLRRLTPKLVPGASVIIEGAGQPRLRMAIDRAREELGIVDTLHNVDWNTVTWTVGQVPAPEASDGPAAGEADETVAVARRVPLPSPRPETERCALSVVVVFYNMQRESRRTLQSLARSYQRNVDELDYEVIVVDNGSSPDQALSADYVGSFGPEFRLLTLDDTPASPTHALNACIAASRGDAVALMIDGAHVLTPGVFEYALAAMTTYEPAVVAIQQWYVGPGQQGDAQQGGYDQEVEDHLFRRIKWPTDGYRLFDIGHFIGDRDWFDGIIESNCLFAPRSLLEQVGGFDDSFDMPGGGYANLELFERLHSHPGINPATVLGEGTFHQFHGGTTTNVADEAVRRDRIFSYGEHFRELRGRGLLGLNKPIRYVGAMDTKSSRRTRSRREFLLAFDPNRDAVITTGGQPMPVPEELKAAAIEATWYQNAWRESTWLGHPVYRYPTDLHSYQELLCQVQPDTVVLVANDPGVGGRALHAAGVLDHIGAGSVLVVADPQEPQVDLPQHARITYMDGGASDASVAAAVADLVGDGRAVVFIGLGSDRQIMAAFETYAPLVAVDSYVVVENTVVNGRPVESGFGPGPHEAVNKLLATHRDFVADVAFERYTLTFNKNGFLRRYAEPVADAATATEG